MTSVAEPTTLSSSDWYEPVGVRTAEVSPAYLSKPQIVSSGQSTAPWLPAAIERVVTLLTLGDGWDGYGSRSVDRRLAKAVVRFLASQVWTYTPRPRIVATADGGLAVEWREGGVTLELEFEPSGAIDAYVSDAGENLEWEGPVEDMPGGLLRWIRRLAQ
jgi:hypothetical protein